MPLVPGLSPNIREVNAEDLDDLDLGEPLPEPANEDADQYEYDDKGNVIRIVHPDGEVTISLNGQSLLAKPDEPPAGWFSNLANKIDPQILTQISENLLREIETDKASRADWVDTRATGLKLLGLKVELGGASESAEGAPVEGMSKVRHPLLLEACLRFQANARGELLPADGPVKMRDDGTVGNVQVDEMASALEKDLNHYLTVVASEYYPDTDRMLLLLGFGGMTFKKVYFCPLRNRPVSESIDADNLIINNSATDINNAKRITHRTMLKPSTVKRLQILGVYRDDVQLGTPMPRELDAVQQEKADQQGIQVDTMDSDDRDREIYECYCELDIKGFEHKHKGKPSGLAVPYRVTIDVSSRQILSLVRNYDKKTEALPKARRVFVTYTFIPGFDGFYGLGLLHILGNTTNAVTAAWRELLDAGMFAAFPGFLFSDAGGRQNTNVFRVPPGGGALVKSGGMDIREVVMPLPYKEPSPALMSLVENISMTGMRLGSTTEQQIGEGRIDAPVGTTLAMIEQAQKLMSAVHKRLHTAQGEEFRLLVDCFREHPESFWENGTESDYPWEQDTFERALDMYELTPRADPNTASHVHRLLKIGVLKQLQAANPTIYDPIAVDSVAIRELGWSNPEQFFVTPEARSKPPPEVMKAMAEFNLKNRQLDIQQQKNQGELALKGQAAQADIGIKQGNLMLSRQELELRAQELMQQGKYKELDLLLKSQEQPEDKSHEHALAEADLGLRARELGFREWHAQVENENRDLDRDKDLAVATTNAKVDLALAQMKREEAKYKQGLGAGKRD